MSYNMFDLHVWRPWAPTGYIILHCAWSLVSSHYDKCARSASILTNTALRVFWRITEDLFLHVSAPFSARRP